MYVTVGLMVNNTRNANQNKKQDDPKATKKPLPLKKTDKKATSTSRKDGKVSKLSFHQAIRTTYYTVWSVVGIALLVLLAFAVIGEDSWVDNLNLSSGSEEQQTTQTAQPQQAQPTEQQLACIEDELGEERLAELRQGGTAQSQEEAATIRSCLTN